MLRNSLRQPFSYFPSFGLKKKIKHGWLLLCIFILACETETTEISGKDNPHLENTPPVDEANAPIDEAATDNILLENVSQTPDKNTLAPTQPNDQDNIVADMEFSGAQEDILPQPTSKEVHYCLSETATPSLDTESACRQISKRLASVSYQGCSSAKLTPSGCESVNGFPILMSKFAPVEGRVPQGKILVIGGTHGDELTSVSVAFRWIQKLNKFHSGLFHWHVTPMMNPDGVLKREASRTNINGVDLNRNMPSDDWINNAHTYWESKGNKDPRKFPGETAASEPETQWLIDEINRFQPDAIISIHAPYGVVDFDSLRLNTAPKSLGKLHLNLLGTYPGSLGNYAGINRNIPVITLELPHAWEMPTEQETTRIWEDIVSWLKKNVNNPEKIASAE